MNAPPFPQTDSYWGPDPERKGVYYTPDPPFWGRGRGLGMCSVHVQSRQNDVREDVWKDVEHPAAHLLREPCAEDVEHYVRKMCGRVCHSSKSFEHKQGFCLDGGTPFGPFPT
jgi:hypothetical protein